MDWKKIHLVVVIIIRLFSLNVALFVDRRGISKDFIECRNVNVNDKTWGYFI